MPLDSTNSWFESDGVKRGSITVEEELEALQRAVAEARRHAWTDPDPIEPELENFLAALTTSEAPATDPSTRFFPEEARRERRNSWREVLEDVG